MLRTGEERKGVKRRERENTRSEHSLPFDKKGGAVR